MSSLRLGQLAAVMILAGCATDPIGENRPSYFRADVEGALEKRYVGSGEFHTGTPAAGRLQFQLTSEGEGASASERFVLTRWDGGRLGHGTYPLALVPEPAAPGQGRGITVQFFLREGNEEQSFVAESGELEVTSSSRELVEGRFRFEGFRYCAREVVRSNPPAPPVGPCTPMLAEPIAGAPRITVTGTFRATPLETTGSGPESWR